MRKMTINFVKADLRMSHLVFWDWVFPIILILVVSIFLRGSETALFLFPGLLSMIIFQSIIFSIPNRFALFNEQGILKLVREKGDFFKLVISFFISRVLIVVLQIASMLAMGKWIMEVPLKVSVGLTVLSTLLSVVVFFLIATLCGVLVKTQNSALGIAQALYFIFLGVSGTVYPLEKGPEWLAVLSKLSPFTYLNELWDGAVYSTEINLISNVVAPLVIALVVGVGLYMFGRKRMNKNYIEKKEVTLHENYS